MSQPTKPKAALVLDINVYIDALKEDSPRSIAARQILASHTNEVYLSDTMLQTLGIKLIELGANPQAARDYLEMLRTDDDFGPELNVLTDVPFTEYDITDRDGNPDHEDAGVVSTMDATGAMSGAKVALITSDTSLRDWCAHHGRMAVAPQQYVQWTKPKVNTADLASLEYLAKRAFTGKLRPISPANAKAHARRLITDVGGEATSAKEIYQRYPELDPGQQPQPVPDIPAGPAFE